MFFYVACSYNGTCSFCGKEGPVFDCTLPRDDTRTDHVLSKHKSGKALGFHEPDCPGCAEQFAHSICANQTAECKKNWQKVLDKRLAK